MNDAWILDVATRTWEIAFNGHSDSVLPTGSIGTLWRVRQTWDRNRGGDQCQEFEVNIAENRCT